MTGENGPTATGAAQQAQGTAKVQSGRRAPDGAAGKMLVYTALAWSLFQLWYASPLPFLFDFAVLNNAEARSIHLAFALFLAFTFYSALKHTPGDRVPIHDWVLGAVAALAGAYLFLFYPELSQRPGAPILQDVVVACVGVVLLLEATRRAIGPPLAIVAIVLLAYTYFGPYMPSVIAHKGASISAMVNHHWITTEGVYGVPLGVSTDFVFLFVLFGALLEKAGAGSYFIRVAFSLLGHMRGGPAKAAVVASGMTGIISGSSIANVVTTGTFTIPLMKRVGFPSTKAGAIEVAASTNGQLTPPIMGAAAFLMVEFVGIPYVEIIKHAVLPALIAYIGLIYIIHLEALKADMRGLPRREGGTLAQRMFGFATVVVGIIVLSALVYYGIGWMKGVFGAATPWLAGGLLLATYLGLLRLAARYPAKELATSAEGTLELPPVGATLKGGLHFLLPVVVLVWCLTVERFSPGLSAFWATVFMMFTVITQRPVLAWFRGERLLGEAARRGLRELFQGLVNGARNMIGIGVATAAAGIVVGAVTQTGIGLVMTDLVEAISGGNLLLVLIFTALICVVLGLGLPTTANYIVVSSLMAPVIVALATKSGLAVPLIAAHMFVFYFGILADDTPPVGLAAYAAAAISGADPIRTGIQGFTYDIRTAMLPFMFIFNPQLLLIGIGSWWELSLTVASAVIAMLAFASATQRFLLVRSRWWEIAVLLLAAFTLFRPGFWIDRVYPPLATVDPAAVFATAAQRPADAELRLIVEGEDVSGERVSKTVQLPLGATGPGAERLASAGLELIESDGRILVDNVAWNSFAAKQGIEFDWEVTAVEVELDQPSRYWMYLPALAALGAIVLLQLRRRAASARAAQETGSP